MLQSTTHVLGKGFDRITAVYDVVSCIFSFNKINTSQLAFLSYFNSQQTALLLGGGTGYFLQKVVEQNKNILITYVDASPKMIAYSRERIIKNKPDALDRITFICSGVEDLEWKNYDAIVCNYFLDLFDNAFVQVLAIKFRKHLNPEGFLYVTDFHISETNNLLKWCTQTGLKLLYAIFRWSTQLNTNQLPEIDRIIIEEGFQEIVSKKYLGGILKCRLCK